MLRDFGAVRYPGLRFPQPYYQIGEAKLNGGSILLVIRDTLESWQFRAMYVVVDVCYSNEVH